MTLEVVVVRNGCLSPITSNVTFAISSALLASKTVEDDRASNRLRTV